MSICFCTSCVCVCVQNSIFTAVLWVLSCCWIQCSTHAGAAYPQHLKRNISQAKSYVCLSAYLAVLFLFSRLVNPWDGVNCSNSDPPNFTAAIQYRTETILTLATGPSGTAYRHLALPCHLGPTSVHTFPAIALANR